jgi:[histone H3]-trimethyl-L-lysine4 demethylase
MNDDHNFMFERPPSAPIFRPTIEEFSDPIEYINGIRNTVEKFGICKIIPPKEWQPPFCIDNDEFKFVPRLQRLNELEVILHD